MTDTPTGAKPRTIDGVVFRCWRIGVLNTVWRTDDGRCIAWANIRHSGYHASVDGNPIRADKPRVIRATRYHAARRSDGEPPPKRFQTIENAMQAAVTKAYKP